MSRYAVCLVSDDKYMLPTVVAASQARRSAPRADIDVFVLAMGLEAARASAYARICDDAGVILLEVSRGIFGGVEENAFLDSFFAGSSFTFGAVGRFFLDQALPPEYDQLLYLDGDISVNGSLEPLIRHPVPEGHFLAAPDPKVFWIRDGGSAAAREQQYMAGLGLSGGQFENYFNSGVIRAARAGWRDIGLAAWRFLQEHQGRCVNHDQSALNAVARAQRLPLSLKWNFPIYMRHYGLEREVSPIVTHFMSRPKPWNGAFPPWSQAEHAVYRQFAQAHADVSHDLDVFGPKLTFKYSLQQRLKAIDERLRVARSARIRARVLAYEALAAV